MQLTSCIASPLRPARLLVLAQLLDPGGDLVEALAALDVPAASHRRAGESGTPPASSHRHWHLMRAVGAAGNYLQQHMGRSSNADAIDEACG